MLVWLGKKSDLVNPKAFISLGGGQFYVASVSHSTYEFDLREFFSVYAFRKSDSHALPASGPQGLIWRSCGSVYGTSFTFTAVKKRFVFCFCISNMLLQ